LPPPPLANEGGGGRQPPPPLLAQNHCYYEILGVECNATDEDLKEAYRKLAVKHHPDKQKDAEGGEVAAEQFKLASRAYKVLTNPEKRKAYNDVISLVREIAQEG